MIDDVRYIILIFASIKCGYKCLLVSPRNSLEGNLALIEATKCKIWLVPTGVNISDLLERHPMTTVSIPGVFDLINDDPVLHFEYIAEFEASRKDPVVVLHTSGSTGLPKPITCNYLLPWL